MRVEAMKERIDELMEARQKLWIAACEADGIDPKASFVVFSDGKVKKQPPDLTAGEFNRSE